MLPNGRQAVNGMGLQSNSNQSIGWIVQKFGGTSIGKFAEKIAEDVVGYRISLPHVD
jgi:aspartate kinase